MLFSFSFQNFEKAEVIIKLNVVKYLCPTQVWWMTMREQLTNNGLGSHCNYA